MAKFYAVGIGREVGVFGSWSECEAQVSGYPNAKFQRFNTQKDADNFVKQYQHVDEVSFNSSTKPIRVVPEELLVMTCFVDGSYNPNTNTVGSSVVVLADNNEVVNELKFENNNDSNMRNVYGEIFATQQALEYASIHHARVVRIVYDYQGIESWANGNWRCKNDYTKRYAKIVARYRESFEVEFVKVTAHTGVQFNERADILAKEACQVL